MNLFAVSFFGHREVDDPFVIEQQLEAIIRELLHTKEYVEFLVGRDGEFDQLVSSTVRRCKRTIRDDNSFHQDSHHRYGCTYAPADRKRQHRHT